MLTMVCNVDTGGENWSMSTDVHISTLLLSRFQLDQTSPVVM